MYVCIVLNKWIKIIDLSFYSTCLRSISDMLMVSLVFNKYTDYTDIAIIWQKESGESDMNKYNAKYFKGFSILYIMGWWAVYKTEKHPRSFNEKNMGGKG